MNEDFLKWIDKFLETWDKCSLKLTDEIDGLVDMDGSTGEVYYMDIIDDNGI